MPDYIQIRKLIIDNDEKYSILCLLSLIFRSLVIRGVLKWCIVIQMSRPNNDKFGSTVYSDQRKKLAQSPSKNEAQMRRTQGKTLDGKKKLLDNQNFHDIALHEKDERFRYLLKNGELKKVEKSGNVIFAELPQIPNVWVCYRRPV